VLRIRRTSTTPRIIALVVLALVRARRGDPGHAPLLDEAWSLAEPTGESPRIDPVVAARAELDWLHGEGAAYEGLLRHGQPSWSGAAALWTRLGCPYEAALARARIDDESHIREAGESLVSLGAAAAMPVVSQRLRALGVRGLPRGPRAATRSNPANLTERELDVLALVAEGLRNNEIASRLVVSQRTVDHHVSAILRKLDVRTRGQAGTEAIRRGLLT
jgi:DNA-binding CsgD family transcriptional regulator